MKKRIFWVAILCCIGFGFAIAAEAQRGGGSRRPVIIPPRTPAKDSGPVSGGPTGAAEADAAWNERSYARALELYRKAVGGKSVTDADEVEFRIAVSLGKTEKWDEAVAAGEALLAKTMWKARVYYWLGRLYTQLPHQGYKVGGKLYRGEDYPKIEGAERPQQMYLGEEDAGKTLEYFELAKLAAAKERQVAMVSRFTSPTHALSEAEEVELNFDLAAWLPQRQYDEYIARLDKKEVITETVDIKAPYDRAAALPNKVLYLYNQIATLDQVEGRHKTALSLLAKGLFIRSYRQRMDGWARQYDEKKGDYIVRPYPFDHLEPVLVWQQVIDKFRNDPVADRVQILIAQTHMQQGDMVKALAAYRAVLTLFPKSKWVSDAKANIQQITRRELVLDTMGAQQPGQTSKLTLSTRNLKQVELKAYPVRLEDVLTQTGSLNNPQASFTDFSATFGSIEAARKYFGPVAASWSIKPKDKGDYRTITETIDVPLKSLGAYVVVAQGENVRFARMLIISDLAILKKSDRDSSFAYVADAATGRPVPGANVVIKEIYYQNGSNHSSIARGNSDGEGFMDKKLTRGRDIHSSNVSVFAWVNNRYAITGSSGGWWGFGDNTAELKAYAYTDRPVYRPEQKVYFRQMLTQRIKGGDLAPVKGMKVQVTVNNPKGEKIYDETLTTSEFGTVNGEFTLPAEAPLGEYYIQAMVSEVGRSLAAAGGNRFRVEEYKRPEFEVSVDAPGQSVRPGETVSARINAKYYFGSPVPNATVKYTVRRSTWWSSYKFPTRYDWLYRYWNVGDYDTGRRNIGGEGSGAIVKEGTVQTDAQGNAEVSFTASKDKVEDTGYGWWWRAYANPLYVIEAEVTDASRRTIEGQGSVKVANQEYFAFLDAKRGYYMAGDRVQVEVVTQDANDKPFAATGKMVVYKLLPGNKEEKVFEEAISTPASGRQFWTWTADDGGQFRIAYEATDAWGMKVAGSTQIWVGGASLNTTQFRLQGVTIVIDKQAYTEGETLHALLVADQPGTTVLLTQEAGAEILKRELVFIEGKSREIDIPIVHEHVPNFAIAAAIVKNYQVYQAQQEVFVPPVKQLINVSVTGDKAEYKPGEVGTFTIKATDSDGKPARAEVSVALADASLFYIQKDYAPDLRTFYYGERRGLSVNLDSHRSGVPGGRNEDDQKYVDYESHGWELPDDMGMLGLFPGGDNYYYYGVPGVMARRSVNGMVAAFEAAPMSAPAPAAAMKSSSVAGYPADFAMAEADASGGGNLAQAEVRSNFAETAFWSPAVVTEGGEARVEVKFPDSLTKWHATVRGLTTNAAVGAAETDVATKKNLLLRMQAPRFLTQRDQVVLTANIHNYLKTDKKVKVALATGDSVKLNLTRMAPLSEGFNLSAPDGFVTVKAGEEMRVNWLVDVVKDGTVSVQMTAQTDEESDAVRMEFPVLVHGVQRFAARSGVLRNGDAKTKESLTINFPKERQFGASQLNVQLNPSLAATMLDALPYLSDYPYGCVEQTMSRFLPTVIAAKVLTDSGIDLEQLRARAKAYEAEAKAQPLGERIKNTGYTYPKGQPNSRDLQEMASRMWHTGRAGNPLFDKAEMDKMTREGLNRLYAMQRPDGGWGWWQGSSYSDEYMSAYVVFGLATAKAAEISVRDDVLQRGFNYLQAQMKDEDNIHLLTALAYSLSLRGSLPGDVKPIVSDRLFNQRERLTAYSKSLLAMALWNTGEKEKAGVVVRNIENTAVLDNASGTARWKMGNQWWCWWNNDIETNAIALRAFLQIDPKNKLVPMMMKWLTLQARGNHWNSTKQTAEAVYALADYVRVNRELDVDYTLTLNLNGKVQRTYRVNAQNALYFDNRFISGDLFLQDGANTLTIEKQGRGNLYWNAYSEYFSLEEPIEASGNEIAIRRRFFKLTRNPDVKAEQGEDAGATPTGAQGNAPSTAVEKRGVRSAPMIMPRPVPAQPAKFEYTRTELKDGDLLKSGDLVEVELVLDAANDYEYLVFEDMKAAGLEPVELRSGSSYADGLSSNVELRDEKVAFFVDRLKQGTHVLRYRLRAEIPGNFHALPTNGYAMYAPEVRAISGEQRVAVRD